MKAMLIILDGWGVRKQKIKNAITKANTPIFDHLLKTKPNTTLKASGEAVGLPKGTQGNSEVGHITLGAGRIVPQMLTRINKAIKGGAFYQNTALVNAINHCKKHNTALHVMGLVQDQGVHAHVDHALAIIEACKRNNFHNIKFHCFTDGRDTHPKSAKRFIRQVQQKLKQTSTGRIVTVCGRFYAMDRDTRWARTKKAYDAIVLAKGNAAKTPISAINNAYTAKETDEFIMPAIIGEYQGIVRNDAVVFFNFRYDRARQLTKALTEPLLTGFKRQRHPKVHMVAMSQYYDTIKAHVAFPELHLKNVLGEVLQNKGLTQLRIAETEKYAHVTYFFNGQNEVPFKGEERILVKSTRKVRTYDKAPQMGAFEIAKQVKDAIRNNKHDVVIVNFANADMVGHTGDFTAAVNAIETLDQCLGQVLTLAEDIPTLITADHGNAEDMGGVLQTSHTTNEVPLILIGDFKLHKGTLADVAPTLLALMHMPKPREMSGVSLLRPK